MRRVVRINPWVVVSEQPPVDGLEALADLGFRSVLNLAAGELGPGGRYPAPADEELQLRTVGIEPRRLPLSLASLDECRLELLCHELRMAPKPLLVHSRVGREAIALAVVHIAVERLQAVDPLLRPRADLDAEYDDPRLPAYVHRYAERRPASRHAGELPRLPSRYRGGEAGEMH